MGELVSVLSLSLSGSLMALALMAAKPLLKNKVTKTVLYYLWLIVLLRLILPFSAPANLTDALLARPLSSVVAETMPGAVDYASDNIEPVADGQDQTAAPNAPTHAPGEAGVTAGNGGSPLPGPNPAAAAWSFALKNAIWGWAFGACLSLIWYFAAYLLYSHKIRASSVAPQAADAAVFRGLCKNTRVKMACNRYVATPMLIGVFRPCIVVPRLAYVQNGMGRDLANILRHELVHYKRKDLLVKWLVVAATCVHWFNPFMIILRKEISRACELACDEAVIRDMTRREKQWYGNTLLALSAKKRPPANALTTTMCEEKRELKERLTSIMKHNPSAVWKIVPAVILAAVMAGCAAVLGPAGNAQPAGTTPEAATPAATAPANTPADMKDGDAGQQDGADAGEEPNRGEALSDLLEASTPGASFVGMDGTTMNGILAEYGALCENYSFTGRVSGDGKYAYIVGEYIGADPSPFKGLKTVGVDDSLILYDKDSEEAVEKALAAPPEERSLDGLCWEITKSAVQYSADNPQLIYIEPKKAPLSLLKVAYEYITGRKEYILDAISRGVMLSAPDAPFITVYRIADQFGETGEYIPLTAEQLDAALADEPVMKNQKGKYFLVELQTKDDREAYNNRSGIPRSFLDIVVQKCAYRFEEPSDLGAVVSAQLTVKLAGLERSQTVTDPAALLKLETMLRMAKPMGSMGGCGFCGQLILTFDNGGTMTLYKGCDGCDTIVFGSYGCYTVGADNNALFWKIFDEAAAGWRDDQ